MRVPSTWLACGRRLCIRRICGPLRSVSLLRWLSTPRLGRRWAQRQAACGVEWPGGAMPRRAQPGPAVRKDLTPEALDFLSRPEVRGDVDCHGNSFVAPAPTEAEAAADDGDG